MIDRFYDLLTHMYLLKTKFLFYDNFQEEFENYKTAMRKRKFYLISSEFFIFYFFSKNGYFSLIVTLKGLRTDTTYFDFRVTQINSTERREVQEKI